MSIAEPPPETWLADQCQRLLDLTEANPLLSLDSATGLLLEILLPHGNELFPLLVQESTRKTWSFWLPPDDGPDKASLPATSSATLVVTGPGGETLERPRLLDMLGDLQRRSEVQLHQRGQFSLHVGFGILEWTESDDSPRRSPVVLVPVRLVQTGPREPPLLQAAGEGAFLNPALTYRLTQLEAQLPALPQDASKPLTDYFAALRTTLTDRPGWQVPNGCMLTLFAPFNDALARDLERHAEVLTSSALVRALTGDRHACSSVSLPRERDLDNLPGSDLLLDADGSQRLCVEAARRGETFVLSGPTGAGKTQTLANIIADALARGDKVLVVAATMMALKRIADRLREAGLGDHVLELDGVKAGCREVIDELVRCTSHPPGPKEAKPAADLARRDQLQDELRRYVHALHEVRAPLQRTVWQGLAELSQWPDVPALPLGTSAAATDQVLAEVTPGRLEEYGQVLGQLQKYWHVGTNCPWQGFKAQRHNQQLRDEVAGLIDKARTRLEKLQAAQRQFAGQVGVDAPLPQLLKLGDLLDSRPPGVSAAWLRAPDLAKLAEDVETCASRFQEFSQALAPLTARYGKGIWNVPDDTPVRIREAWHRAVALLAPGDEKGAALLAHQQKLRGWAADTQKRLPGWLPDIRTLEKWLAIPLPTGAGAEAMPTHADSRIDPSPHLLKVFLRLAHLCQSEHAPERTWVHNAPAVEEARKLVASAKPVFAAFRQNRRKLLETYTEQFFELDLKRMADAFAGPYRSWFRMLSGQFRRDRRAIARRSREYGVPATAAQDVMLGRDVLEHQGQIEAGQAERKTLLGRYERGLDTDIEEADRALRVAGEAHDLVRELGCSSPSVRFVDALCSPTPAPEKIRAADKRLQDSFSAWHHATQEGRELLPRDRLPGVGAGLDDSALSAVVHFAKDLQAALNQLANLVDPILGHAPNPPTDLASLVADVEQAARLKDLESNQAAELAMWKERLGECFHGLATDWQALRQTLTWTRRVREWFGSVQAGSKPFPTPPESFITLATATGQCSSLRELRNALEPYQHALHALESRFDPPGLVANGRPVAELAPADIAVHLGLMRDRIGQLAEWIEWRHLPERLEHLGFSGFWQALRPGSVTAEQVPALFWKSLWSAWVESVLRQEPVLANFQAAEHERTVNEFRLLDAGNGRADVLRQIEEHRRGAMLDAHEIGLLKEEASKQSGQLSLPRLFEALSRSLLTLKPCLLMHACSVSPLLSAIPGLRLDLVIVADADQVPVAEGLPALFRGKQALIAGAAQQNLLGACLEANVPHHTLRCHHGALREEPAAFASRHLHEGRLTTFPAARTTDAAVLFRHVARGTDQARLVADLVLDHWTRHADQCLGVVTLADSEADAVCRLALAGDPASAKRSAECPLIVPGYSACGVSRDVIVLDITWSKDDLPPADSVAILITASLAARRQLIVVSSLKSQDLSAVTDPAARLLADFLAFAEAGTSADTPRPAETPLHRAVAAELQRLGYRALPNVGLSAYCVDLAVVHPDRPDEFILGILFDGPIYASAETTRERDRLRPLALKQRGWKLHSLWSPAWARNRAQEIARLQAALTEPKT